MTNRICRFITITVVLGGLVAVAGPLVRAQQATAGNLDVVQVRPNFYVIAGDGGNIAVQIGPAGAILVDSGSGQASDKVLAALGRLTDGSIRYIIDTSADADHTGGNEKLAKAGKTILGNTGSAGFSEDVFTNGGGASILAYEDVLTRMSEEKGGAPEGLWPTKTYSNPIYPMYLNGDGIQVIHMPAAHTDGDSVVFFHRSDVIATGDIVDMTRFPVIDVNKGGSIQGEIDALDRIVDLTVPPFPLVFQQDHQNRTYIVPGHGYVCDFFDLVEYRSMVMVIRDRIQDLVKKGMSLEQVKAADPAQGFKARYGSDKGPWTTDMFVEAAYKSLTAKGAEK